MDLHISDSDPSMRHISAFAIGGTRPGVDTALDSTRIEGAKSTSHSYGPAMLPAEILAIIFQECLRGFNRAEERQGFVLVLSYSTSYFRNVAVSTPSLWCDICVTTGNSVNLSMNALFLERSGACPLRLSLHIDVLCSFSDMSYALDFLIPHIERWENFQITGHLKSARPLIIERLSNAKAPILKHLHIRRDDRPFGYASAYMFESGAPSLVSIRFHNIHPRYHLPPLASLKRIQLIALPTLIVNRDLQFLSNLHHLTHLNIIDTNFSNTGILQLPVLVTLAIRVDGSHHGVSAMMSMVRAPLLERLVLLGLVEEDFYFPPPDFPALCSLTVGDMEGFISSHHWEHRVTLLFPHITDFTFIDLDDDTTLPHFPYEGGKMALSSWKHLHALTVRKESPTDNDIQGRGELMFALFNIFARCKREGCSVQKLRMCQRTFAIIQTLGRVVELENLVGSYEICDFRPGMVEIMEDLWMQEV